MDQQVGGSNPGRNGTEIKPGFYLWKPTEKRAVPIRVTPRKVEGGYWIVKVEIEKD
jgi:hypothetical protein